MKMLRVHFVAATCPFVGTDTFIIVQHQFGGILRLREMSHTLQLVELHGTCREDKTSCPRYTSLLHVTSVCTTQVLCRCYMSLENDPSCLPAFNQSFPRVRWMKCIEFACS